jgi:16S rRNA (uracil1498-N3)-methyltransferase
VEDLESPELTPDDRHHLVRVLRVRPGDALTVSDGAGRWRSTRLGETLRAESPIESVTPARPELTIAFALVKSGRPELVAQKLTELGVDTIIPFVAERSVVRWDAERGGRHVNRLRRVAREAAMQCRRPTLPRIGDVATFAEVAALPGAAAAERHGVPPNLAFPTLLVGPEGGWSAAERSRLEHRVTLGDLVLRSESAAIAGATLLAALRGGAVRPAVPDGST